MPEVDYLTEDTLTDTSQRYVCLSFLADTTSKSKILGIKVRGVFQTYEEACNHAKKLQHADPYFNVFVGDVGKWLPFNPDPDSSTKDIEYANEELNGIMKSYLENQEKAKLFHEQRKSEMVRQNILDNLKSKNEILSELKQKLNESSEPTEIVETDIKSIEDHVEKMDKQILELDDSLKKINEEIKLYTQKSLDPDVKVPNTFLDPDDCTD
jgi:hypothetical protein